MSNAVRTTLAAVSGAGIVILLVCAKAFYDLEAGYLPLLASAALSAPILGLVEAYRS